MRTRRLIAHLLALAALVAPFAACRSEGCLDVAYTSEPEIQVVDAVTGDAICDAAITQAGMSGEGVSDAGCPQQLACTYEPCWSPGTYSIEVSHVGYVTKAVAGVTVFSNVGESGCESVPPPQQVHVALEPE